MAWPLQLIVQLNSMGGAQYNWDDEVEQADAEEIGKACGARL